LDALEYSRVVKLSNCPKLTNDGIECLISVRELDISYNDNVTPLFLDTVKYIESLTILECPLMRYRDFYDAGRPICKFKELYVTYSSAFTNKQAENLMV
jgi:hypothetical protein